MNTRIKPNNTYNFILSFIVFRDYRKPILKKYLDDDVKREETLTHFIDKSSNNIIALNVTKEYRNGKKVALHDVSFHVNMGECFGLLGSFESGKSTLLQILCAVIDLTSGKIYINGVNINKNYSTVQKDIVYCPFEIFLFEEFTVYEHLKWFLNIHGLPKNRIKEFINKFSEFTGVMDYLSLRVKELKDGIRKKNCIAITLLNSPKILLLDEPTHGVNVKERREIWNLIQNIYESQRTVIISSNIVAECEALCTRLAIVVNGEFSCIGSVQAIKNKFCNELILKIKLKSTKQNLMFFSATSLENTSLSTEISQESMEVGDDDIRILMNSLKLKFPNVSVV